MTLKDAQELLDSMLPRINKYKRNTNADKKLTVPEEINLLMIVIDFERLSGGYNYSLALYNIKNILDSRFRASSSSKKTKKNGEIIYLNPPAVPFLIKQVIFFIAVSCIVYKQINCTQADICEYLKLGHNFFGKLGRTPKEYVDMQNHKQPDRIITYNGHKDEELGIAIKNLVYQAGKHDYFVDLFGGTGAASTAVNKRNNTKYVYNEKDKFIYNLFEVIADDKLYKRLAIEINEFKDDLYFGKPYSNSALTQVDFSKEIEKYYNSKKRDEGRPSKTRIASYTPHKYKFKNGVPYLRKLIDYLKSQGDSYYVIYLQKKYSKQDLLNILDTNNLDDSLNKYWEIIILCSNLCLFREYELGSLYDVNDKDCFDLHKSDVQYRFYKYYAYFSNKRQCISINNDDEKVLYAVACIFIYSLTTNGDEGISSILRIDVHQCEDGYTESSKEYKNFLGDNYYNRYGCNKAKDYNYLIEKMHKAIRRIICENKDFKDSINKYKDIVVKYKSYGIEKERAATALFYSDSPYIATKEFKESFKNSDMISLINALVDSGDKFIFSCRAVYGSVNGTKTSLELIDKNGEINKYVFQTFLDHYAKGQKFYVLAIEKAKKGVQSLKDLIKGNLITEVMLTNYEIESFSDDKSKKVSYTKYEFEDFIKAIMKYSNYGYDGKIYTTAERKEIFKKYKLTW